MSFQLTIKVTATCDYCSWKRECFGLNADVEATAEGTRHVLLEHPGTT